MWTSHHIIDPNEISARFSTEDSLSYMDSVFSEMSPKSKELLRRVKKVMHHLPDREADFVVMYYFLKLKQVAIANIFNVSQPTVCYRLQRAASRIHFLLNLPPVTFEEVQEAMDSFLSPMDSDIMVLMYETTCQSEVASRLGVSQGMIRHRFMRSIEKMKQIPGLETFVELFSLVASNLNILREVTRDPLREGVLSIVE